MHDSGMLLNVYREYVCVNTEFVGGQEHPNSHCAQRVHFIV